MGRKERLDEWLLSKLSRLRDGGWAAAKALNDKILSWCDLELHSRAIVGSAKACCWVLDIYPYRYLRPGFLSELDSMLRWVAAIQTSLNDWLESGRPTLLYSFGQSCLDAFEEDHPEEPSEASMPSYAVVVSALVLLSLVYQYLTANVDRGGSRAYSRSSLDFRDVYVAIILFLGAYVWIKFREAAPKGFYSRTVVDNHGGSKKVYEARLYVGKKVPRLELGRFSTEQDARNMYLIAAFYYKPRSSEECLLDGWFSVPSMSDEEQSLTGLEKRNWVLGQAKKVYEDFKKEEAISMVEEFLKVSDDQMLPKVNVNFPLSSILNSTEQQQPVLEGQVENSEMDMAMLDNHRLECASHSFKGMYEDPMLSNGHVCDFQEGSALPVSQLPTNTESGMSLNDNDQFDVLQGWMQHQISLQQQQISNQQHQISLQQREIQELGVQILQLQHQQRTQEQQLQESENQNPEWPHPFSLQERQLQDINQGIPSFAMEHSIYQ